MQEETPATTKENPSFHAVVEAADRLSADEQETPIEVLNCPLADRRRAQLVVQVREAQDEYESGTLRPSTPQEIMAETAS